MVRPLGAGEFGLRDSARYKYWKSMPSIVYGGRFRPALLKANWGFFLSCILSTNWGLDI